MKITKTQINYLRDRLREIKSEKIKKFREDLPESATLLDYYDAVKAGKVKLKSRKAVEERVRNFYRCCSPDLSDLFDVSYITDKTKANSEALEGYEAKLDKAMTEIMDKVVLSDLMIEEAVAEFKKL